YGVRGGAQGDVEAEVGPVVEPAESADGRQSRPLYWLGPADEGRVVLDDVNALVCEGVPLDARIGCLVQPDHSGHMHSVEAGGEPVQAEGGGAVGQGVAEVEASAALDRDARGYDRGKVGAQAHGIRGVRIQVEPRDAEGEDQAAEGGRSLDGVTSDGRAHCAHLTRDEAGAVEVLHCDALSPE